MATVKPTTFSRWNTGGANRTEPTSGKKDTGWVLNEEPSSSFFNWLQHFGGLWDEWVNERMFDGGDEEDVILRAPVPAGAAGSTTLGGTDGVGAGNAGGATNILGGSPASGDAGGGAVNATGGDGSGTGNGGFVNLTGGAGGATGLGGDVQVEAGPTSNGSGGTGSLAGGLVTGTDQNGGLAVVRGGVATGDGSSDAVIRAVDGGQGSGATSRSPSDYLRCDGSAKVITTSRSLVMTATDATRAPARFVASTRPTTPARGDMYVSSVADNSAGKSYVHTGSRWEGIGSLRVATIADSNSVSGTVTETAFNQGDTIPADFAQLNDLLEMNAGGSATWATGNITLRVKIGGQLIWDHTYLAVGNFHWQIRLSLTIENAGIGGLTRSIGMGMFNGSGSGNEDTQTQFGTASVDFTASNDLEITAQWASAAGGNSITMNLFTSDIR